MTFFTDLIRGLFFNIDSLIYWVNGVLFELFILISETRFISDIFDVFYERVYAILGIVVLFRVAFSLIQTLINPDLMSDKQKSPGKLVMRVVVALMLIIAVPSIFTFAYDLQGAVLEENIIGKIVLGDTTGSTTNVTTVKEQGKYMAWSVFRGFFNIADVDGAKAHECAKRIEKDGEPVFDVYSDPFANIQRGNCLNQQVNDEYVFEYKWLISTIATVMVAWMLIGFCLDVGVRVIKLGFLQLIAPIPISSYILGDKDSAFSKWTKSCLMTYLEVFIRLLIIYFVIFLSSQIFNSGLSIPSTNTVMEGLVKIVVVLGLLVFAKQAPDLLKDMFGIKGDASSFSLNPMSRINSSPLAKLALGGAVAGVAAGAGNIGKRLMDSKKTFNELKDSGKNGFGAFTRTAAGVLGSGIGGIFGGAVAGGMAGLGKDAKVGNAINKGLMTANANRELRSDRSGIGYGPGTRIMDNLRGMAGIDSEAKKGANAVKNRLAGLQQTRSAMAQRQYDLSQTVNPELLSKLSAGGYTYSAFDKQWTSSSGDVVDIYSALGVTDFSGYDFGAFEQLSEVSEPTMVNRDDFMRQSSLVDASGNSTQYFDEAAYNKAMEDYNTQMASYQSYEAQRTEYEKMSEARAEADYLRTIEQISGLDKDIISTQKELGKWEKEQNRVERKKSSN